jgi:hypothetical protein
MDEALQLRVLEYNVLSPFLSVFVVIHPQKVSIFWYEKMSVDKRRFFLQNLK